MTTEDKRQRTEGRKRKCKHEHEHFRSCCMVSLWSLDDRERLDEAEGGSLDVQRGVSIGKRKGGNGARSGV